MPMPTHGHTHLHMRKRTCMHTHMHKERCTYTRTYARTHACACTHAHACTRMHACPQAHACTCTCVHRHAHAWVHLSTCVCTRACMHAPTRPPAHMHGYMLQIYLKEAIVHEFCRLRCHSIVEIRLVAWVTPRPFHTTPTLIITCNATQRHTTCNGAHSNMALPTPKSQTTAIQLTQLRQCLVFFLEGGGGGGGGAGCL